MFQRLLKISSQDNKNSVGAKTGDDRSTLGELYRNNNNIMTLTR